MENAPKVLEKDFMREVKRVRKEISGISDYINFTYDIRPLIKVEVGIAGTGSMDLEMLEKFNQNLKKITEIVKTFKYDGYELVYNI